MHFFDLRVPLGWLFLILGGLLIVSGFTAPVTSDGVSLGVNIDIIWGTVLLAFAIICLWFARRHARKRALAAARIPEMKESRR
jgi:hypothetical protein